MIYLLFNHNTAEVITTILFNPFSNFDDKSMDSTTNKDWITKAGLVPMANCNTDFNIFDTTTTIATTITITNKARRLFPQLLVKSITALVEPFGYFLKYSYLKEFHPFVLFPYFWWSA